MFTSHTTSSTSGRSVYLAYGLALAVDNARSFFSVICRLLFHSAKVDARKARPVHRPGSCQITNLHLCEPSWTDAPISDGLVDLKHFRSQSQRSLVP